MTKATKATKKGVQKDAKKAVKKDAKKECQACRQEKKHDGIFWSAHTCGRRSKAPGLATKACPACQQKQRASRRKGGILGRKVMHTCALGRKANAHYSPKRLAHLKGELRAGQKRTAAGTFDGRELTQPEKRELKAKIARAEELQKNRQDDPTGKKVGQEETDPAFFSLKREPSRLDGHEWTKAEEKVWAKLRSPQDVSNFLEGITYDPADPIWSVRVTLMTTVGHCLPSSMVAYYALAKAGFDVALVGFEAAFDDDRHAIVVWRRPKTSGGFLFGAVSKSNFAGLLKRDSVHDDLPSIVKSFYEAYYEVKKGRCSITGWRIFNPLRECPNEDWLFALDEQCRFEEHYFDANVPYRLLEKGDEAREAGPASGARKQHAKHFLQVPARLQKAMSLTQGTNCKER
jgi:hypothetical protein